MRDDVVSAFWSRYGTPDGGYPRDADEVARLLSRAPALPEAFVRLLTFALVRGVAGPELRVGPVGDWLGHALERHATMRALADTHGNPVLASMVPFGDTPDGLEVALDLGAAPEPRVVWLDPGRYDDGPGVVVRVDAPSLEQYLRARLAGSPRTVAR
jgi:hypothetical protein